MMQETGSNRSDSLNTILSIRFAPSGLYCSITKQGYAKSLSYTPLLSDNIEMELKSCLAAINGDYECVNVIIDTDSVVVVPEELIVSDDIESAKELLNLNSLDIPNGCMPIVTESKRGVRAIVIADATVIQIFKNHFSSVEFYATIISDMLMESNAITVTINDNSTSISCIVDEKILYADVIPVSTDLDTVAYYIENLRGQFETKNNKLPVYISGSKSAAVLTHLNSITMDMCSALWLDGCALVGEADMCGYNDLIRL